MHTCSNNGTSFENGQIMWNKVSVPLVFNLILSIYFMSYLTIVKIQKNLFSFASQVS